MVMLCAADQVAVTKLLVRDSVTVLRRPSTVAPWFHVWLIASQPQSR